MAKRVDWNVFWNSNPTHQSARLAVLFHEKFEGKIQNIVNDNTGRLISISFTQNKQTFHVFTFHGPNKPCQRENLFQNRYNYINSTQNTIIGGDFSIGNRS